MIAKFLSTVKARASPSMLSQEVETFNSEETLKYDQTVNNEGKIWLSYKGRSGIRRYCCIVDKNGKPCIDPGNNSQIALACYFDEKTGRNGNNLNGGALYYAELLINHNQKSFKGLGGLPYGQRLKITYKDKSVIAYKGDERDGGINLPKIGIHENLAKVLGFPNCLDYVLIEKV